MSSVAQDDRLRQIESIADTALAHLDVDDLLNELLDRVRELLQVDTAAVLLLDRSSERLVATAARGLEGEVRQGFRIPIGTGFAGRIAADKHPVAIERVDHTTVRNPVLWEKGVRSLLGVPMLTSGTVIGVLHVGTLTPRRFTDENAELLQLVADRAALAARARGSEIDQAAAGALQRSLLPARLPSRPEIEMAARYVAGEKEGVGGDWYDVFSLPSDGIGIAIGDVVGRGLNAAVVMGRLRSALRAYALESDDPATVLQKLHRKVEHFEPGMMATVAYAILEPPYERLYLSVAGHFPPVMAQVNRPTTLLDVQSDPPVGVPVEVHRRTYTVDMPPGALLCLYTDGLVERRGSSIDENLERLRTSVTSDEVESVCTTVMAKLIGDEPTNDDIALLALRHKDGDQATE